MLLNHLYFRYRHFTFLWVIYVLICVFYTTNGFRCGKYGFICLNKDYFKKCDDKFVRELPKEVIYKCPKDTFCNERFRRACDLEAENRTETQMELDMKATELGPQEEEQVTDVIKADLGDKESHANMTAETAKLSKPVKSDKIDTKTMCPTKTRFKRYFCPSEGAFADRRSDQYFFICYRDRKSINDDLQAVSLQCPDGMVFDPKSRKCVPPYKLMVYKFPHKRKYNKYN